MIKICALLLTMSSAITLFAQPINKLEVLVTSSLKEAGELPYSETPLTWNNFKGSPDNSCEFIAMTYSGIKMKYEYKARNGSAQAKVLLCPYMDINQSWYKKEGHNETTLAHEQRHFDITAIVAHQFAEEIKKRSFTIETFQHEMKTLHQEFIRRLEQMQKEYDAETDHGIIPDKQAAWDKRLAEEVRLTLKQG